MKHFQPCLLSCCPFAYNRTRSYNDCTAFNYNDHFGGLVVKLLIFFDQKEDMTSGKALHLKTSKDLINWIKK